MRKGIALLLLALAAVSFAHAHSGGTDKNGCHAGSKPYHCH
ncbi:MAG TPA: YHYH domain-containing protein [Hydrogenophaga sp.]|nr:YHYH domain-containing protein [Hydrogenophaga sp.]HSX95717.1 YHYH domain-containing protein [Hydrogenophaga sp.]